MPELTSFDGWTNSTGGELVAVFRRQEPVAGGEQMALVIGDELAKTHVAYPKSFVEEWGDCATLFTEASRGVLREALEAPRQLVSMDLFK